MLIIQLRGQNTWSLLGISRWTLRKLHRWTQHIQSIWAEFAVICSSWTALLVQTSKKKCMICMELCYTRSHAYTIYGLFHVALLAAAANGTKLCNVRSWLTRILPRNKRRFRCVISGCCSKPARNLPGQHCDMMVYLWKFTTFLKEYVRIFKNMWSKGFPSTTLNANPEPMAPRRKRAHIERWSVFDS